MSIRATQRVSTMTLNIVALIAIFATMAYATEALKNHAPEKRQDDSFLFFGGWRPIKPGTRYHHRSSNGKYHDLLSAIPDQLDTSSTYFSSAQSDYNKDIYNYYPRPAIRSKIRGKAPVYMESYKRMPNQQQHKKGSELQIPGLQGVNIQHLKGLHEVLLSQLPLSHLSHIPLHGGKVLELAVQPLQKFSGFGHLGNSGHNDQGGYTVRHPLSGDIPYLSSQPIDLKSAVQFGLPKSLPVVPLSLPGVQDALDLKNIQIVEIPVPSHSSGAGKDKSVSRYGNRINKGSADDTTYFDAPKSQQQIRYMEPYIPTDYKQSQHYSASIYKHQSSGYPRKQKQPPQIAAELVTINDEQVKHLLKNIQIFDKNSNDILRYVPLSELKNHHKDLQLVVALPPGRKLHHSYASPQEGGYQERIPTSHAGPKHFQEVQLQVLEEPQQHDSYETPSHQEGSSHPHGGGYQMIEVQGNSRYQAADPYSEGNQYQTEEKESYYSQQEEKGEGRFHQQEGYGEGRYQHPHEGQNEGAYQHHHHQQEGDEGRYQIQEQGPGKFQYQQRTYGNHEQQNVQQPSQPHIVSYQKDSRGQAYIEVNSHIDENGHKREPVLAVELQKGQTIEDAIKALDPETLQKLGANTKDGVEIEVVEIPVDEYAAESKKRETIVPKNSTMSTISTTTEATTTTTTTTKKS